MQGIHVLNGVLWQVGVHVDTRTSPRKFTKERGKHNFGEFPVAITLPGMIGKNNSEVMRPAFPSVPDSPTHRRADLLRIASER